MSINILKYTETGGERERPLKALWSLSASWSGGGTGSGTLIVAITITIIFSKMVNLVDSIELTAKKRFLLTIMAFRELNNYIIPN